MYISIRSEMDSRVFLYPLMRALYNYGSMLVLSNNKTLNRLIEDTVDSGFRGITVIVDDSESADEICGAYDIRQGDYDFVILDNLGASDYDVCFILVGAKVSPEFDEEIELLLEDTSNTSCVLQFGKSNAPVKKAQAPKEEKKERRPEDKFNEMAGDVKVERPKPVNVPFPNFQDIEILEAEHRFSEVNQAIAGAIYSTLESTLAVDRSRFMKEVRRRDESSGYLKPRDPNR